MRRKARTDSNHAEIVATARSWGASVLDLSRLGGGAPDLAIGYRGKTVLVEIKDGSKPPSHRRLTPDEDRFFESWRGAAAVIYNRVQMADLLSRM